MFYFILSENIEASTSLNSTLRTNLFDLSSLENMMLLVYEKQLSPSKTDIVNICNDMKNCLKNSVNKWLLNWITLLKNYNISDNTKNSIIIKKGFGLNSEVVRTENKFTHLTNEEILLQYSNSCRRFVIIDADACFMNSFEYENKTDFIFELNKNKCCYSYNSKTPFKKLISNIQILCQDKKNIVVLISNKTRKELDNLFYSIDNIILVAELGYYTKFKSSVLECSNKCCIDNNKTIISKDINKMKLKLNNSFKMFDYINYYENIFPPNSDSILFKANYNIYDSISNKKKINDNKFCTINNSNNKIKENLINFKWISFSSNINFSWIEELVNQLKPYANRCEGSYIIEKSTHIIWNYKNCDYQQASAFLEAIYNEFEMPLKKVNIILETVEGELVFRPFALSKEKYLNNFLSILYKTSNLPDFLLFIGESSNEDIFKSLNKYDELFPLISVFTISVGDKISNAKYHLNDKREVHYIFKTLNRYCFPELKSNFSYFNSTNLISSKSSPRCKSNINIRYTNNFINYK